jgi:two-component system sensor histidine kinase HydH
MAGPPGKRRLVTALQIALIAGVSVGLVLAHYLTSTAEMHLHDIYRRLLYIPIILAAFWFGLRGALLTSLGLTAAYFPHIYRDWGGDVLGMNLNRTLEACMYNIVALITGGFAQRLRHERDRLARANRELEEKTRQIFEAEEQLRRADRLSALGKLSAGLAHEIRNPLGSIRGTAEILSDRFQPGDKEYEFFQILEREVHRLNGVLTNFLEFARGERNSAKDLQRSCSVRATLESVRDLLTREIAQKRVDLRVSTDEAEDRGGLSREHLSQVILNLLLNALQSAPDGGVIEVKMNSGGDHVRLAIGDSGPGIPEELREEVFQPFFTTREGGTGLGLAIVSKILDSHGATLELGTSPLGGAEFALLLPRASSGS